ncbi:HAUS augmin-like complex subunit 5 [Protopterus annectens]|uniref:HAUS augmin-like complex subunit 5 n=1 Tax=Protopterus annectens TaxID=7888 RepID=UPI001CFACA8C|nr:HAUS augmin-like complex subunit 5 [Protopterus annectens]
MERKDLASELKQWVTEEMGMPARRIPSDALFRKMCLGRCADIWKYVVRHVYSSRYVKKVRGNLLWYKDLRQLEVDQSEAESQREQRKVLMKNILTVKLENEQLNLQIEAALQSVDVDESSMELTLERIHDSKMRTQMLKAFSLRMLNERKKLREHIARISSRIEQCQHTCSKGKTEVVFGGTFVNPDHNASPVAVPEPAVLRVVKKACLLRHELLMSLLKTELDGNQQFSDETEAQFQVSYQHWLSLVENIMSCHPPSHILLALEYLASQNTLKLREMTSRLNISEDIEALKFRYESRHLKDVSKQDDVLPTVKWLIQDGWNKCEQLEIENLLQQDLEEALAAKLTSLTQEYRQLISGFSETEALVRTAFDLELTLVGRKAFCHSLLEQSEEIKRLIHAKHLELQALQQKRQQVLDFQQLVIKKQESIRKVIKGNSINKSQLKKSRAEIEAYIEDRLLKHEMRILSETGLLRNWVDREVQHFKSISLPCFQRMTVNDVQRIPVHELSIHGLDLTDPTENYALQKVCHCLHFPMYKAPEQIMYHVADKKLQKILLSSHLQFKESALKVLEQKLSAAPDTQGLLHLVLENDRLQLSKLLPAIHHQTKRCIQCIHHCSEVQKAVTAWLEQPAQFTLPWEKRHGLSLQQWHERWTLAVKALQEKQGNWT